MEHNEKEHEVHKHRDVVESGSILSEWVRGVVIVAIAIMVGVPFFMHMFASASGSG
jgi:hypothetical protein